MRTQRFLAVSLTTASFILTLLFAAVVGAQEKSTDTEGVGAQSVEVQQQRAVAVQQQVGPAAADASFGGRLPRRK